MAATVGVPLTPKKRESHENKEYREVEAVKISMLPLIVLVCALAGRVSGGAVCTWTGEVSSEWDVAANWSDGVKPGDGDVAFFRSDASVSPPDSFGGVLRLEGRVTVTATVPSAAGFTLSLKSTSAGAPTFVKRGDGALVLRVARGINPGTVTVAEGAVDFARNAAGEPGAFDRIVIASGASARVADSSFQTRHGVAVKAGFMSFDASSLPADFGGFFAAATGWFWRETDSRLSSDEKKGCR